MTPTWGEFMTKLRALYKEYPTASKQYESDYDALAALHASVLADCLEREKERDQYKARLAEAEQDIEQWKKVYDLRGRALQRPCINCGYVPQVIRPADSADEVQP